MLDLPTAIRRMTGMPADALGLVDRGRIVPGAVADLVLFDPLTVRDASTYDDSTAAAIGVEAVLIGWRLRGRGRATRSVRRSDACLRPEVSGPRRPRRS